jgi:hypothetical protein
MAAIERTKPRSGARQLTLEDTLFRAALLARYGRNAGNLARRLASVAEFGDGRSCLEAGAPLHLTVDAPGPAGLRVGLRIGDRLKLENLRGLVPDANLERLTEFLAPLPAARHRTIGTRLFWTEERQSIFVDLRDPNPDGAFARLHRILDRQQRNRLDSVRFEPAEARPWALRVEADASGLRRLHLHWLIGRGASPESIAETIAPGRWKRVTDVLAHLLRRPGFSGRWLIATPLEDRSRTALRIGNSGWTLVPEDERKHRAIGQLMEALGGQRDHAEALWSLCRGGADATWKVGRACDIRIDDTETRVRLLFTPQIQAGATAVTRSSESALSSTSPGVIEPSRAKRSTR